MVMTHEGWQQGEGEMTVRHHSIFWTCTACGAQNHEMDGECQYCECGGAACKRLNCDDSRHFCQTCEETASLCRCNTGAISSNAR